MVLCACAAPRKPVKIQPAFRLKTDVTQEAQLTTHYLKAEVFLAHNEWPQALEHYQKALQLAPEDEYLLISLATLYLQQQMPEPAISTLQKLLALNPRHTQAYLLLAGAHMQNKNTKKALKLYQGILKKFPQHPEVLFHIGLLHLHQGQIKKGEDFLKQVLQHKQFKDRHEAYFALAMLNMSKGPAYFSAAHSYFRQAIKLKPDSEKIRIALIKFYEQQGQQHKAIQKAVEFQGRYGPSVEVAQHLAHIYMQNNQLDKAYKQLSWIESHDPSHINTKLKIALILVAKKKPLQAIKKLEYVAHQNPDVDRVHFYLASLYQDTQQNKKALSHFLKVHPQSSFYNLAVIHSSNIYFSQQKFNAAARSLWQAIEKRPEVVEFYSQLAAVHVEQNNNQQAAKVLEQACEKFKNNAQLHYFLANTYEQLGQAAKARTYAHITLKLNPLHVGALNYLAYSWAESNQQLDQAYLMASKAQKLKPDDPYILDTLGWVLFKQGKYKKAVYWLEKAQALEPELSIVAQHLAEAQRKLKALRKPASP